MLSIKETVSKKQILAVKPQFILAVDYASGSLGGMLGEDSDLSLYLADMTIQYHSLVDDACLAFTVECLVSANGSVVTIEEMNTSSENQSVYAQNIDGLQAINSFHTFIYVDRIDDNTRDLLIDLIENQPIYDIPEHYTTESY